MTQEIDGREAYRDDPEYTAPEMQPRANDDGVTPGDTEQGVVTGTAMTAGVGGGALAGSVLVDEVEEEKAETTFNP
jgi:hypothetical protein